MTAIKCGRCGSDKIMPNLPLRDRYVREDLEVEVASKPDAKIFKQVRREALIATVCGECGNVGISVKNPKALWEAYTRRQDS